MTGPVGPLAAQSVALNLVSLLSSTAAPNAGGGVAAAIGSMYLQNNAPGAAWLKTGAGATNWQQMIQSYAWLSILDYGADATGATDSTAAIQDAINAANAQGGGVVFVPPGTFNVTQLSFAGISSVQLKGIGPASHLRWSAAAPAGSMIVFSGGAANNVLELLQLDGSDLTGAAATNHLVALGTASGAVTYTQIVQCLFTGMPVGSGDGVHVVGDASDLVSVFWISDCQFNGCGRYGVGLEQGYAYGWIEDCYLTACQTEIAVVSTASQNGTGLIIHDNVINHTSASVRWALRLEADATDFLTQSVIANNVILGGFVTTQNVQDSTIIGNVATSGAFASTDAVWKLYDSCKNIAWTENLIDRNSAASAGPCVSVQKSTTSPAQLRLTGVLINEVIGGNFATLVDCAQISCSFLGRGTNAGSSTIYGIDCQAVTATVTDIQIGPGCNLSAAAGTMESGVRLYADGANITNAQICGNNFDDTAYGATFQEAGGGTFNGLVMWAGNIHTGTTGDYQNVGGAAVQPVIGGNAATKGIGLITGTGAPNGTTTAEVGALFLRSDGGQGTALNYKESGSGNTGWIGVGGCPIVFGAGLLTTLATTAVFYAPGYIATASATDLQMAATRPGTVRNLYVVVETAGVGAATVTSTVVKNGATTALTASISNTATGTASDTTDTFTVVAGDLLSIQVENSGAVATAQSNVTATIELA